MSDAPPPPPPLPPPPAAPAAPAVSSLVPDGPHSWMVAAGAMVNMFFCSLLRRSVPVLFSPVSQTFHGSRRQPTAWVAALIYGVAYVLGPLTAILIRRNVLSLRVLSFLGTFCIGLSQVACFLAPDVLYFVPTLGVLCGVGTGVTLVVNEVLLCQHFERSRRSASELTYLGSTLAAIAYPWVLVQIVDYYGLHSAMLISGGITLNGLAGSVVLAKPMWVHDNDPNLVVPVVTAGELQAEPELPGGEDGKRIEMKAMGTKGMKPAPDVDAGDAPEGEKAPDLIDLIASRQSEGADEFLAGTTNGAQSQGGASSVAVDVEPAAPGTAPEAEKGLLKAPVATVAEVRNEALDWTVGPLVVVCCMCTALGVPASVVLYDYAEDELKLGSLGSIGVLVATAIGDFMARILSPKLLKDHEYHRLVLALQCFLNGGVLFLLSLVDLGPIVVFLGLALGWTSGSIVMLIVPVLKKFLDPEQVERMAAFSRVAFGVAILIGPLLVGRTGGRRSGGRRPRTTGARHSQ